MYCLSMLFVAASPLVKCKKTLKESYIQMLDHATFDRLDAYTPHVDLPFDIYFVFNYDI